MEKQFIPYELALKLQELGFNEECCSYYTIFGKFSGDISNPRKYNSEFEKSNAYISAPLWQQAFDWFREKYNIDSYLVNEYYYGYSFNIIHDKFNNREKGWIYEEARLGCLEKLIELIESSCQKPEKIN